jgi:CRP-like cAMP-binding protein
VTIVEASRNTVRNALLHSLLPADIDLFLGMSTLVSIPVDTVLETPHARIEEVYFPETGVFSIDAMTRAGLSMQIAMIGREGASGTALVLGNASWAHTTVVHVEALAWKISAANFQNLLSKSLWTRNVLLRYTSVVAGQMASAALANGRSTVPERFARWILQMYSRTEGSSFEATQEVIAAILGVRRQGITAALQSFEKCNLVLSTRGRIEVIDHDGLIAASGGSYRDGD